MKRAAYFFGIIWCLTTFGCSSSNWWGSNWSSTKGDEPEVPLEVASSSSITPSIPPMEAANTAEPQKEAEETAPTDIELLWQISENVETYNIYFGPNKENLEGHIELPVSSLQKQSHPVYGETYRYLLRDVPRDKEIFIAVSAKNSLGESPRSLLLTVPPLE